MGPRTLFLLLVFLPLWGADEALAASWLPGTGQPTDGPQPVFPLSLRDRVRWFEQTGAGGPPPAPRPRAGVFPRHGRPRRRAGARRPAGPDLLYLLMSLRR